MNQQAKTKRSFPYVALILWVTLVLVVFILGYTLVDSIGIIGHLNNAAKSDNFDLNESQVDVYRYHVAQNELYYQYMYIQYGMMQDPTGGLIKYMDANAFINYMLPAYVGDDSFDESAYAYAEQYLTYCEGAKEAGLYDEYKAEVASDIEDYIDGLKATAEANGVTFGSYLQKWIGKGVNKKDIETAMEYYYIGGKYAEKLFEDFSDVVTVEEINKYRDDNKASFYTSKYTSYKLVSSDNEAFRTAVEAAKTTDDVKTAIVDYYMTQKYDAQYKTNFTDKKIEDTNAEQTKADVKTTLLALAEVGENKAVFTDKDTDDYKKAAYAIVKAINTSVSTETAKIKEATAAWADPAGTSATDLQKWLFANGRKADDFTVLKTETTTKDQNGKEIKNVSYTWYVVEETDILDKEYTKNAHYIVLSDDAEGTENAKTAKEKADAFQKALKETNTPEKFKELVETYAPGFSSELVERIGYEDMKGSYENLADWLYDEKRKEGDVSDLLEVNGDTKDPKKVTGYIVALFVDTNEKTTWELNATDGVANEKLTDWFNEAVKKYNVVIDYEHDHDHGEETTDAATSSTPADTSAATEAGTEAATEAGTEAATEAGTEAATSAE